jgi:hypothetical protein
LKLQGSLQAIPNNVFDLIVYTIVIVTIATRARDRSRRLRPRIIEMLSTITDGSSWQQLLAIVNKSTIIVLVYDRQKLLDLINVR